MSYSQYLDIVTSWAEDKGYLVLFESDGDDSIDCDSKIISIKSTNRIETQLYVLLHECGHALIRENGSTFHFKNIEENYSKTSKISKVFVLMEEVEAWKRGYRLASRLGVRIDDEKWNRAVSRAIWKYAEWTSS